MNVLAVCSQPAVGQPVAMLQHCGGGGGGLPKGNMCTGSIRRGGGCTSTACISSSEACHAGCTAAFVRVLESMCVLPGPECLLPWTPAGRKIC
jgi:hypothetical protein